VSKFSVLKFCSNTWISEYIYIWAIIHIGVIYKVNAGIDPTFFELFNLIDSK
jgi:hypothetical protein